jgi:hypothetical protein
LRSAKVRPSPSDDDGGEADHVAVKRAGAARFDVDGEEKAHISL